MAEGHSDPTPIPARHEPPPVPHPGANRLSPVPPPIPDSHRIVATNVPAEEKPSVRKAPVAEQEVTFVMEDFHASATRHVARPLGRQNKTEGQTPNSAVNVVLEQGHGHGTAFLTWVGLLLALLCIPFALAGSFAPGLRSPFWLTVLMFAFIVIALEKYAKKNPGSSVELVRLALGLGYGFLVISLIGLVAAGMRAGIYVAAAINTASQAVHKLAESWHESNGIIAWFLHKADAIMQFFASHAPTAAPSPLPSPSPTPVP